MGWGNAIMKKVNKDATSGKVTSIEAGPFYYGISVLIVMDLSLKFVFIVFGAIIILIRGMTRFICVLQNCIWRETLRKPA